MCLPMTPSNRRKTETENSRIHVKSEMAAHACNPSICRLRQEDGKLKARLGYVIRCCFKKEKNKNQNISQIGEQPSHPFVRKAREITENRKAVWVSGD